MACRGFPAQVEVDAKTVKWRQLSEMVARLHLLLPLMASLPLLAWTRSELSVTKCAVKFRDYSRIMDKTVKQARLSFHI